MFNGAAANGARAFWTKRELFAIHRIGKGIHLLFNDVGGFTHAAGKEPRGFENGRTNLTIAVACRHTTGRILKLFPDATGYIAIENNKPDAIEKVVKTVGNNPRIKVLALMTKYPQGSEKQLINAVTGREVPSGALPANAGCIVDNVDTVVAIETAVCEDRPLMRRIVTLTGDAANNPGNYEIRIGMNMNELIEMAGGLKEDLGKIIAGGPMMGPAMFSTDCPFIKTSSALLCLTKKSAELPPESNCIRCAKCINACPMGLMPAKLNKLALAKDYEGFAANNGLDCIECGSCSYVCPAKRHLTQTLRICKRETMAIMRAKAQKK